MVDLREKHYLCKQEDDSDTKDFDINQKNV